MTFFSLSFAIGRQSLCEANQKLGIRPSLNTVLLCLWNTEPYQRTLFLLGTLVLPETWLGEPRFFSVGYVDDQQFVSFDSDSERQREEPRAPWVERMERVEPGCWERNTRIARAHAQIYRVGLEKLLNCFKQSEGDPPSTRVTRHTGTDGEVTLRCRAQDFYPADISLTWLEGWGGTLQDVEFIETRDLPEVGQEGEYTCRVQHEGLSEPLTLKWEPESSSTLVIVGVITVLLLIAAIAGEVGTREILASPHLAACLSVPKSFLSHLRNSQLGPKTLDKEIETIFLEDARQGYNRLA
uniref:Ig-like domain-containing protein n=1 Tax=Vombatus ursinus TaxID=29139 RepID=A0A4X2KIY0_VOMUR